MISLVLITFFISCSRSSSHSLGELSVGASIVGASGNLQKAYKTNNTINFSINFTRQIELKGIPVVELVLGSGVVQATGTIGPEKKSLDFTYTFQPNDYSFDGIIIGNSITQATVTDSVSGASITLSLNDNVKNLFTEIFVTQGNIYYLSNSGNDANDGESEASPWQSLAKVNSSNFSPGDIILLNGAETFEGNLYLSDEDSTNSVAPIVISSYGEGKATIVSPATNQTHGIMVYNQAGIIIENLIIKGADGNLSSGFYNVGVFFYSDLSGNQKLDMIKLRHLVVHGYVYSGVVLEGANGTTGYSNVTIDDVESYNNHLFGLYVGGSSVYSHSNFVVRNSKFHDNLGISGYGSHTGSGLVLGSVNGGLVERNIAYNNGENNDYLEGGPIGIWTFDSTNIVMQYNESYANKSQTKDGGGFDLDGGVSNSIIQFNYSHDNDGAGYLVYNYIGASTPHTNNIVRYNISQNDGLKEGYSGIFVGGADASSTVNNLAIYNNLIFSDGLNAIVPNSNVTILNDYISSVSIRNNIFITSGGAAFITSPGSVNVLFQGNNYFSVDGNPILNWGGVNHSSVASWQSASPIQETLNSSNTYHEVNPLLRGNVAETVAVTDIYELENNLFSTFGISESSPMIDSGLDLSSEFGINIGAHDFFGNESKSGLSQDIGVHEYKIED